MYLGSDISFLSCTRGWGNCTVDGDYNHGPGQIEINGHIFEKGYVSHAPGKATFPLYGLLDKFSTCIGISKVTKNPKCGVTKGDARFRVLGDGKVLQAWMPKSSPEDPTCFEVDITDVNELILETHEHKQKGCDLSTWADAKVHKRGFYDFLIIRLTFYELNI